MNLRRSLLPIHRWVGLTLGLVVLVSAVTGAGMAFREELDPLVYPHLFKASACAAPLPLDAFVERARALRPKGTVDYVRVRGEAGAPVQVRLLDKDTLFFDRCTGALTGAQNRYAGVFGVLEYLHRGQWIQNGGWIMGAGALSMVLVLSSVGLFLWWPRKPRRFSQGFVVDRRLKGPMFTVSLHKAVGAWAVLFVTLSAVTGLPNAYDSLKEAIVSIGATQPEAKPKSIPPTPRGPKRPLQDAWATVTRLSPGPQEVLLHLARKARDPVEIFIIEADAPHANARTYLYLDAYSGRVLRFAPYRQSGLGSRIYYWMLSLHTGQVGGLVGQLLLFLGAASIPVLAYTGFSSYLRRRFRKPKARRTPAATAPARS
ncbi:MAG: hypothetical protein JWQ52_2420 [Phenylobacterium sp.]|jgi:uncharacterized iron-regulated membrane protein|nr:hypothetical protein [Phenylobacterium sp.]